MMVWDLTEESRSPPVKTPKKLLKLTAELIARQLAKKALSRLSLIFHDTTSFMYSTDINLDLLLRELQMSKHWYWYETDHLLGKTDSFIRYVISASLVDGVLKEMSSSQSREKIVFLSFVFQTLFGHSTGNFPTICCYSVSHFASALKMFFNVLGPFQLLSIQDTTIVFGIHNYLAELLRLSPNLSHIFLSSNLNLEVLRAMRDYCKKLEIVELEVNDLEPIDHIENILCKIFFSGNNIEYVLQKADENSKVEKSFLNLKEVYIYSLNDFMPISCNLLFLLQHFYPEIKTRWLCKARTVTNIDNLVRYGMPCQQFVHASDRFNLDTLSFSYNSCIKSNSSDFIGVPRFLKTEYLDCIYDPNDIKDTSNIINSALQQYRCDKMVLDFAYNLDRNLMVSLLSVASRLNELYLTGGLLNNEQNSRFFNIISACVNLKSLGVELVLDCEQSWLEFDSLINLENLSLTLKYGTKSKFASKMVKSLMYHCAKCAVDIVNFKRNSNMDRDRYFKIVPSMSSEFSSPNNPDIQASNQQVQKFHTSMCHKDPASTHIISRHADPLDIKELKISKYYPARQWDYQPNFHSYVPGQNKCRHSFSNLEPDVINDNNNDEKKKAHLNELASIFSEMTDVIVRGHAGGHYLVGKFGLGYYGDGSFGLGFYGYGMDGFGFYGHGKHGYGFYGYGRNGYGFYGKGPYGCGFYGDGFLGYGLYETNPKRGSKYYNQDKIGYKYFPQVVKSQQGDQGPCMGDIDSFKPTTYHYMQVEVVEIFEVEAPKEKPRRGSVSLHSEELTLYEYDPITTIILSLISKAPNLKALELPGATLNDLRELSRRRALDQIKMLKISNLCTPEIIEILENMRSLSLLVIDGKYGVNNYFAYKNIFQRTGLRVELYNAKLIYKKSSILNYDRRRLRV